MKKRTEKKLSEHKEYKYNKKELSTDPEHTLIIIDWDDTLFPTSWTVQNNIDLTDPRSRYKYIKYFENLDRYLSNMLEHITKLGDVLIITNAVLQWIELSSSVLPKTKKILSSVDIVSARDRQKNNYKMNDWKKYTFMEEILKRISNKKYYNILSLGDAEFEHNALVNLYHFHHIPFKYLKSIKFIKSTEYDITVEQIKMIKKYIGNIIHMKRHIDLTFDTQ